MQDVIADVPGMVFAFRDDALLVVVRGLDASPFGPAYEPVRREIVGRCHTLGWRGTEPPAVDTPDWAIGAEVSIYKIWAACPPYEHECAEMSHVAS